MGEPASILVLFTMFKKYFGLKGQALNYAISTIAGCDFLLFGYGEPCLSTRVSRDINTVHDVHINLAR